MRIRSFTAEPGAIADYGPLEDETGTRLFEIESLRVTPKALSRAPQGRGAAARRGRSPHRHRSSTSPPRACLSGRRDEWYHSDLIGLAALDPDGAAIGTVIAVHNFGAGDLVGDQARGRRRHRADALHPRDRA